MAATSTKASYEDFEPFCKWQREEGHDTLEMHLQGFKKEELRIQINNLGIITVTGERSADGTKRSRFRKEIRVSNEYKANEIHAKLSPGVLQIIMPKKTPSLPPQNQTPPQINLDNAAKDAAGKELATGKDVMTKLVITPTCYISRCFKYSISKLKMDKMMAMNVAVAIAVVVGLGAFVMYKYHRDVSNVQN